MFKVDHKDDNPYAVAISFVVIFAVVSCVQIFSIAIAYLYIYFWRNGDYTPRPTEPKTAKINGGWRSSHGSSSQKISDGAAWHAVLPPVVPAGPSIGF